MNSENVLDKVVETINGSSLLAVTAQRSRWPKYAMKELASLKVDCVLEYPTQFEINDDASVISTVQVTVLFQKRLEKNAAEVSTLWATIEAIGRYLAKTDIEGVGYPYEITASLLDEVLDDGQFLGAVGLTYKVFVET